MTPNIIASHNKLLYAIINTLYKITTTSKINFANSPASNLKFFGVPKILKGKLQFCPRVPKIL